MKKAVVPAIALTYSGRISLSRPIWDSPIPTAPPVPMVLSVPTALPVPMVHQGVHPLLYMAVPDILLPKSFGYIGLFIILSVSPFPVRDIRFSWQPEELP